MFVWVSHRSFENGGFLFLFSITLKSYFRINLKPYGDMLLTRNAHDNAHDKAHEDAKPIQFKMSDVKLPRWLRIVMVFLKNWKETFGSLAILFTLYLWYFDRISQDKAIFGIILLVSGGFINNIDYISLFKHLGNYKKGGQNESE